MKSTLQNEDVYSAIEFVRKLNLLNRGQNVTSEMFDKGKVAFCPMMFSEYRTYKPYPWSVKKYSNFEWDCLPMPAGPSHKWIACYVVLVRCLLRKRWLGNF